MKKLFVVFFIGFTVQVAAQAATFSVVDSLIERGRYRAALKKLEAKKPVTYQSAFKIGQVYSLINDDRKALGFYQQSRSLKESYAATYELGKTYQKLNMVAQAIAIYEQLIHTDPENILLSIQLGKLYMRQSKLDKAENIFKELIKKDPENPEYLYQLALIAFERGKGNQMINYFLASYKTDTNYVKSIYQLAKVFSQVVRDKDSAALFVEKGLALDSLHVNLNKLKINELYTAGKYKEALVFLKKIDPLSPNDLFVKKMFGRTYYNLKDYDKSENNLRKALAIDSEDYTIYTYLGYIEQARKNYKLAMLNFYRSTQVGKKPRYQEYYNLGMLYLEQKMQQEAIEMFKKSREESNRFHLALYELALTSDSYYKDKKIALTYYQDYLNQFLHRDKQRTQFVLKRVQEIKTALFLKAGKKD